MDDIIFEHSMETPHHHLTQLAQIRKLYQSIAEKTDLTLDAEPLQTH